MIAVTTVQAREHFSEFVNKTADGKERVMLTRRGEKVAVLIPIEDLFLLEKLEEELDIRDALMALRETKQKGSISLEKFKKELEDDEAIQN